MGLQIKTALLTLLLGLVLLPAARAQTVAQGAPADVGDAWPFLGTVNTVVTATGTITSTTSSVELDVTGRTVGLIILTSSAGLSGTVTFQTFNGTQWEGAYGLAQTGDLILGINFFNSPSPENVYRFNVAGFQKLRVTGTSSPDTTWAVFGTLGATPAIPNYSVLMNPFLFIPERPLSMAGTSTTGFAFDGGVQASGTLGRVADTITSLPGAGSLAPVRLSNHLDLYTTIRDAAKNERGVNVTANNNLQTALFSGATAYDARSIRALTFAGDKVDSSGSTADITDRAARLVGRVYGSQGQQLRQTATDFNLAGELFVGGTAIDPRSIRALTASDQVDVSDRTARVLGRTFLRNPGDTANMGDATTPVRIDPTGTTTQPVSAASLPLPTGAATETTLGTRLADATFTGRINTQGQKTMAASTPVVLPPDQTAIPTQVNAGLTAIVTGQQAVTASAVALPSNAGRLVCLKVVASGTQNVFYGAAGVTTGTGQQLVPGEGICRPLDNSSRLFVIAAGTGSTVAFEVY